MPFLFINPIPSEISLHVIEEEKCVHLESIKQGNDFSDFPETIIRLISDYSIEEIWCIEGPGMFTRMRIVTLTLNTIHLTLGKKIKGIHFFMLIPKGNIPILQANGGEYLTENKENQIQLIPSKDIPPGSYIGYGKKNDFTDDKVFIEYSENYSHICKLFSITELSNALVPQYLKDPNITTGSKKNTSHS